MSATDIVVTPPDRLLAGGRAFACVLGPPGVTARKREGDGATPIGRFALRRVLYRADRIAPPATGLPVTPIDKDDGWCDAPDDPAYNRPVRLPYAASHERLWRTDHLYDIVVVLGHNDDPPVAGAGSAIFMHVARDDGGPTQGCIALAIDDLRAVLAGCRPGTMLRVDADATPKDHERGSEP